MDKYICTRKTYYLAKRWKVGDILISDGHPLCGKGTEMESFDYFGPHEEAPKKKRVTDFEKQVLSDKRKPPQIRKDIRDKYDQDPSIRMSKKSLIALENKLELLHGKDAAINPDEIRTDQEMTLQEAEKLVGK